MEPFTFCCSGRVKPPHTRVIRKHFPVAHICFVLHLDWMACESSIRLYATDRLYAYVHLCELKWPEYICNQTVETMASYSERMKINTGPSVTCWPDKLVCRQNGLRALKRAKKQVNECATLCSFRADKFRSVFDVKVCLASQYLSALVCPETSSVCAPDRETIRRSLDILSVYLFCYSFCSLKAI